MSTKKAGEGHPLLTGEVVPGGGAPASPKTKRPSRPLSDDANGIDLEAQNKKGGGTAPAVPRRSYGKRRRWDCTCIFGYCLASTLFLGFLFLCGWMAKISWENRDHGCEEDLAMWLFVTACAGIGWSVIIAFLKFIEDKCTRCEDACDRFGNCVRLVAILSVVAWLIIGSVWTFEIENDHETCPQELYDFCSYLLIIIWSIVGFTVLVGLVMCCILCLKVFTK